MNPSFLLLVNSGWEMEILESQANDSEEETQDEGARCSLVKDIIADATRQNDIHRVGGSDFSTEVLKTYTREKDPDGTFNENSLLSNRSLPSTSNNRSKNINMPIYGSKDSKKGNFILPNSDEVIDLEKEDNEVLLDMRSTERKTSPLASFRKTPMKTEETSGHFFGSLKRNMFGIEDSAFSDFENNTHHSIINQIGTDLHPSDSSVKKREISSPGIGTGSSELHQNSKSDGHCWSMSNKSTKFRDTVTVPNRSTSTNEDAIDYYTVNHSTPLVGTGSGNIISDLNVRSSKSKTQTCRSTNVGVLPINELVHVPEKSITVADLDWTTSSSANLSVLVHKASDYTAPPTCVKNTVLADGLQTDKNHAESDKDSLIPNEREVHEYSPLGGEYGTCSNKSKKSQLASISGRLDISKKHSINLPIEASDQHQKQYEKSSPPESIKSDNTRLQNGTNTEIVNGKTENIKTSSKKVFLKKKLCSKVRPSKRKFTEDVTSVCLNKNMNGSEELFMSRDVELGKVENGGKSLMIDSKTVVEDKLNVTPLISSSCDNDNVSIDLTVKSKDSGRQNPAVEIKSWSVKLDKYCSNSVGKDSGKSKQMTNIRSTIDNETAACFDENPTGYKESFMSVNMQHEIAIIDEQNLVIQPKIVAEDNSNITPFVLSRFKNIEVGSDMGDTLKVKGSTVKLGKSCLKKVGKENGKSKQRPNKRLSNINETADILDKNLTGSKESLVLENMEDEMPVIDDQNLVKKTEIIVLKSDKYGSERKVKVDGKIKQKANKTQHIEVETASCLDKNSTLNEELSVLENMEHEVKVIDEMNLINKTKILAEDKSNITPFASNRHKTIEFRSDMSGALNDSDKRKSVFEMKGLNVKSDKYDSKRQVKVGGRFKQKAHKRKQIETTLCLDKNLTSNETFMSENIENEMLVFDKQNLVTKPKNVGEGNINITPLISNRCKNIEIRSDISAAIKDLDKQKHALEVKGSTVKSGKCCSKKVGKDSGKSKQSLNKRLSNNNETADVLDKNLTCSKESFTSENMEDEMADIDGQNLVDKPEIAVEDDNNVTQLISNRYKNLKVVTDMDGSHGTSKDLDKQKSVFGKKGLSVKSDKYGSKREVNGSGKSKQKSNKRQRTEEKTAAWSDKILTCNEVSFVSEKTEDEKADNDEQNFVIRQKIVVEDNSYIATPLGSNRCQNLEVGDINGTIKDSDKQKPDIENQGSTVKLNKYGSKREAKVGGKPKHIVEKVGSNVGNQMKTFLKKTVEPVWFIFCGHRWQRKHFKQVIKRLKGKMCPDSHTWYHKATHFIVPEPVRRTEKFVAACAAGRYSISHVFKVKSLHLRISSLVQINFIQSIFTVFFNMIV